MNWYLLPDPHYDHRMLVDAFHRPPNFEELITQNWKRTVQREDVVICLGDLGMTNSQDEEKHEKYIIHQPGKKWLVKGNHDRRSNTWYLKHGWDFVCESFIDTIFRKRILFSHIPQIYRGQFDMNIHGHFHNTDHRAQEPNLMALRTMRHRLVALEHHGYGPINLEDFLRMCDTQENLFKVEAPCYPFGALPWVPYSDRFHAHVAPPVVLEAYGEETPCDICGKPLKTHFIPQVKQDDKR